jgi:SAM-dependent methyltransferase
MYTVGAHNEHYDRPYDEGDLAWFRVCARAKVDNLQALLGSRASGIRTVLEVGMGSGVVLREVERRGIGAQWAGIDRIGEEAHRVPELSESAIRQFRYDGRSLPFENGSFDLAYSSHVLEHVEDERGFLRELGRVAREWIYLEVPCELHLRASVRALQATLDIGHINAYTPESFALTLETSGLRIVEFGVFDHSVEVHRFGSSAPAAYAKTWIRRSALKLLPALAPRLMTYHCGALCVATQETAS